ncbi:hypothetical protein [Rathayibacter toxicus]|uniref:hypothetical protein n=1 Tax=Rathayibacter toxicus TaxID=145458 RepID=UPI0011B0536D|nr:hypothetical protein [Rathayibacter toxicus]QOD11305.1 hypothetical protein BSG36_05040 [Rathayibacter toxicus]QWL28048.1 hypothetical protein E2R33_05050 [Rathayibacter toxicus]
MTNDLLESALTPASQALRAMVLAKQSRALRAEGELNAARDATSDAVAAARGADDCPAEITVSALTAEMAARAELGERDELVVLPRQVVHI